jgi:predicted transcriptional regulator
MKIKDRAHYYEETIKMMEKQLQVFVHESCQVIHTYLTIFGKMTHKDLIDRLEFSRGTIFQSLLLLQEAGFVEKGIDSSIKDKRKNAFYYSTGDDIEVLMEKEFLEYIIKAGKLDVYKNWVKNSLIISTSMLRTAYRISIQPLLEKIEKKSKSQVKSKEREAEYIIKYMEIDSIANRDELIKKIESCIEEFERQIKGRERDYKEPLENPVAFSIFFAPL